MAICGLGTNGLLLYMLLEEKGQKRIYLKILRNQLTIKGSWNSSFAHEKTDDWHYCLDLIARKRIEPEKLISHMLPFDRLAQGMELIRVSWK